MSNADAEAIVTKGCKLLMSNDPNSEEDLRKLLEEIIRNKFGPKKAQLIANLANTSGQTPQKRVQPNSLTDDEDEDVRSVKKLKINENIKSNSNSPNNAEYNNESSNPDDNDDDDDLVMEILEDNVCVVCRSVGSGLGNQIVECLECHDLYHQNCATPQIEADVNDPRFVWYCHNCNKDSNKCASSMSSTMASQDSPEAINNPWTSSSSSPSDNSSSPSSSVNSKISPQPSSLSSRPGQGSPYTNKQFGNTYNKLLKSVKR